MSSKQEYKLSNHASFSFFEMKNQAQLSIYGEPLRNEEQFSNTQLMMYFSNIFQINIIRDVFTVPIKRDQCFYVYMYRLEIYKLVKVLEGKNEPNNGAPTLIEDI